MGASAPNRPVVTRFAPSPTGYLHIGGARTALYNWLYARHMGGKFLLRIEDTDRARSTDDAIEAIIEGMKWLDLDWDGEIVMQFARAARHAEVARDLLANGHAYKCFATAEELEAMRAEQREKKLPMRYDGRWRDRDPSEAPAGASYVVRLKAPKEGSVTIADLVQGDVTVNNAELDDFVLLRSDGTPTYMLSVVVDDHDMGITHVIRGDDHLNNAFRQLVLIRAMGWEEPVYAHVPLIHGADGAKLSKRHGALGVEAYRDEMGYLPEALCKGSIGPDVIDIRKLYGQTGMFTFDPGFTSTASCESALTYIDGDEGVLLHRGYPIGQLAEHSSFMEVCYLLLNGELPSKGELDKFSWHHHPPHHAARAAGDLLSRLPPRCAPDGDHVRRGGRAFRVLSRLDRHRRSGAAQDRQPPPDRQDADDRGHGLQIFGRPAVPLSRQQAVLHRQLPAHDLRRAGRGI
jgi:hypothetical protein